MAPLPRLHMTALVTTVLLCTSTAQLLHPGDFVALSAIATALRDLPGNAFFSTWSFTANPCRTFTGVQCSRVGLYHRVTALSLGPNLAGTLPSALGSLTHLTTLTIAPGAIRGTIPSSLGNLKDLTTLSCSSNYLSGAIPPELAKLQRLEALQVWKNELRGEIPAALGSINSLKVVVLSENRLSGRVPSFVNTSLVHFDVRSNALSGPLPEMPTSVQYFSVMQNRFSGAVERLERLEQLTFLDLSFNGFSGSIPSAVFGFPALAFLLLNHNRFGGVVSVPRLVTVAVVDLSHNRLQGRISPLLAGAQSLFLNNNMFVGGVPQDFALKMQESALSSLYLQHNFLTDSGPLASAALPPSVAVCLLYNCMPPPAHSLCPPTVAMPKVRPGYQCAQLQASQLPLHHADAAAAAAAPGN